MKTTLLATLLFLCPLAGNATESEKIEECYRSAYHSSFIVHPTAVKCMAERSEKLIPVRLIQEKSAREKAEEVIQNEFNVCAEEAFINANKEAQSKCLEL